MKNLVSFDDVVKVLGGVSAVAEMTSTTPGGVCNWRAKRGRFPSKFYDAMTLALASRGFEASPDLWGQVVLYDKRMKKSA